MQWIKSHLTVVSISTASFLSLVLIVLGISLSGTTQELEQDVRLVRELSRLAPVNRDVITKVRQQQDEIAAKAERFVLDHRKAQERKPLDPQVFPAGNDIDAAFRFKEQYRKANDDLLETVLMAKDAPTSDELSRYENQIKLEKERESQSLLFGMEKPSGRRSGQPSGWSPQPGVPSGRSPAGAGPAAISKEEVRASLNIIRAREIRCYAGPDSLDVHRKLIDAREPPTVEEMWYAQVALWLQGDVVAALAGLNQGVVEQLPAGERAWVGNMPVKRVVAIRLSNYLPPVRGDDPPSDVRRSAAGPSSDPLSASGTASAFTRRSSSRSVDVIHLSVNLVIDAQRLLEVVDAISRAGMYTPLVVSYEALAVSDRDNYVYGSAPTISVGLVYEGCFLRSDYGQWMPASVKQAIAEGRADGLTQGSAPSPGGSGRPSEGPGLGPTWPGRMGGG